MAAHYFNRESTDKQFCQLIVWLVETLAVGLVETLTVGLVETLTVGLVETQWSWHFFFIMKAKLDFLTYLRGRYSIDNTKL